MERFHKFSRIWIGIRNVVERTARHKEFFACVFNLGILRNVKLNFICPSFKYCYSVVRNSLSCFFIGNYIAPNELIYITLCIGKKWKKNDADKK